MFKHISNGTNLYPPIECFITLNNVYKGSNINIGALISCTYNVSHLLSIKKIIILIRSNKKYFDIITIGVWILG